MSLPPLKTTNFNTADSITAEMAAKSGQGPVFMHLTVNADEAANAEVKVSLELLPEPSVHVSVTAAGGERDEDELPSDTFNAPNARTYHVGPGDSTEDEFALMPESEQENKEKDDDDEPKPLQRNFKLQRTKTLEIPESDPKQEYEYYQVRKGDPSDRDPLWFPVVTRYPKRNSFANLWVKMDTGADINLIGMTTVSDLGLVDKIQPYSPVDGKDIEEIGGNKFTICGMITMEFIAGSRRRPFTADFLIPDDRPGVDSHTDGLPDVLVGWRFILDNHLLMVDVDYHNDEDPAYDTLSVHVRDEREKGVLKACPLIRPNAAGGRGGRGSSQVKVNYGSSGWR